MTMKCTCNDFFSPQSLKSDLAVFYKLKYIFPPYNMPPDALLFEKRKKSMLEKREMFLRNPFFFFPC